MQLNLGQKIRELRHRAECTQEALADALGVTSQAVSRWESGGGYPDMEMIPSIANFFGISIDELFGYDNDRSQKINILAKKINSMNFQNNGVDINIDECIEFARKALIEFPGNETIMLCLASVLYNAGYVRYGEYHLSDKDGYDIYDTEKHRTYGEWKEAISLYEKLLKTIPDGELRHRAIFELTQLYLNIGEHTRALEIIETVPNIYGSREFLKTKATDGKERAKAYGEGLLKTARACSELMVSSVITYEKNMSPADK
ncbi:MAG: helix-turn-helix domain-containing protein, partial [Clostridia bacterium]|nr:helix-turn-helix domain-containing protein [Clostridia bacterium]